MNNDLSSYFEEPEFREILAKYEGMTKSHTSVYFDAEELTDIAEYYASQGNDKKADKAIEYALKLHPNNTDALVFKARSLCIKGKIDKAYQILDLIEDTSDREVKFLKADLLMEEGLFAEAEDVFLELAAAENESEEVLLDIAMDYMDNNQKDYAETWLERAKVAGHNENNSQKFRDVWCDFCMTFNQPQKAVRAYQLTLDENPYSIVHWTALAKCFLLQDDIEQACEAIEFSLAIDGEDLEALQVKGYCTLQSGDHEATLATCQKILEVHKDSNRANSFVVKCYMELEKPDWALSACMEWLHSSKKMTEYEKSEVYYYIANCYGNLSLPNDGMEYANAALDLNPFSRQIIIQKGLLHLQLNEDKKAERIFQQAIDLSPEDEIVDAMYNIANCYLWMQKYQETIDWCEKIIKEYPETHDEVLLMIANCYYNLKDISLCLKTLAVYWKICNEQIPNDMLNDKRFKNMFAEIGTMINDKNFDLTNYL